MKSSVFAMTVFTVAAVSGLSAVSHAAPKVAVPVIRGAKALSVYEKGGVSGMGRKVADPCVPVPDPCAPPPPPVDPCDPVPTPSSITTPDPCAPPPPDPCAPVPDPCAPPPPPSDPCDPPASTSSKPGYGFGTTGHYGPPGQGFTPARNWRSVVASGGRLTPKGRSLPPRAFR